MNKNSIYVMDVISYYVLSIIAVFIGYSNLNLIESVESEYSVYNVYTFNTTNEVIGFIIMVIANLFLLYFIYRVNKEIRENSILSLLGKELLLLFIVLFLVFSYAVMPYIFMISLPNQVIPTSKLTELIKNIFYFFPLVFFLISFILNLILKFKGKFDE